MTIPISLAVEGELDERVLRELLKQSGCSFAPGVCYGKRGKDNLWQNVPRFNMAAQYTPFVVLTDLDNHECAPSLIDQHLPQGKHANLILRIAVREVEAWLLADRKSMAKFLSVSLTRIPQAPDDELDPKETLVNIARKSRKRNIRQDFVPSAKSGRLVGRAYVTLLSDFVLNHWNVEQACHNSPSLARALRALRNFADHFSFQ
jgi:hypothetical protein